MTEPSKSRKPARSFTQDLQDPTTYEEHLEDINEANQGEDGLKAALNLARKKLRQSVKAEHSLRQRLREAQTVIDSDEETRQELISTHTTALEAVQGELKGVRKDYGSFKKDHETLVLKANLVAEGVDVDRLDQVLKLIDDKEFYTESEDGTREYNFDKFKNLNDNLFLDEAVNPFDPEPTEVEGDDDDFDDETVEASTDEEEDDDEEFDLSPAEIRALMKQVEEASEEDEDDEPEVEKRASKTRSRGDSQAELGEEDLEEPDEDDDEPVIRGRRTRDEGEESRTFVRQRGSSSQTSTLDAAKEVVASRYQKPNFAKE